MKRKFCLICGAPEVRNHKEVGHLAGQKVEIIGSAETKIGPVVKFKTKSGIESQILKKYIIPITTATTTASSMF